MVVFFIVQPIQTLRCFEGNDCQPESCSECEGIACLKIVRHDLSMHPNFMNNHRFMSDHELSSADLENLPKRMAYTCVPYLTSKQEESLEHTGCVVEIIGVQSCVCLGSDFCNSSTKLTFMPLLLIIVFLILYWNYLG
uniref:UPAR/Ly6 domain-containing protein n=1 Tax=Rhabditophanes sp. KR3021 TaxID=114890 RepID=A0AC35TRG7_9BILA